MISDKIFLPIIWLFKKSKNFSALSCRLTQLTGKSKYPLHPKHLVNIEEPWYLADIKANDLVLDLGCGNGQHSLRLAGKAGKIIAVDYNQIQLNIARKLTKEHKIKHIKFIKLDLEKKLGFKNNFFDKILCLDVLEHLYKREQFLKEVKRVLKPKGLIFVSVPNKNTSWKKLQRKVGLNSFADPDHKIEYTLQEVEKILSQLGFKILDIKPIVYDTSLAGFIDLIGGISLKWYKKFILWKKNKLEGNLNESTGFRIKMIKNL